MIKHLEKGEELLQVITPAVWIIDFYADWCGPCKILSPVLEELDVNILKVNVDEHPELATKNGIMSIPTLLFYKEKQEVKKEIGFRNKEELKSIIDDL